MSKRRRPVAPGKPATPASTSDRLTEIVVGLVLAVSIALAVAVRLRLADTPLERDEGEYAYAGQLILQGTPPYALVYNMKFPGTYYAYAALMSVFGETPRGIRIGLLCVNLATAGLLFGLGRRMAGLLAGGVAASSFLLLSLDRWAMGVFAHATHFVVLPVVAALFVLWPAWKKPRGWRFFVGGVLMGIAVAMKQQGAPFAVLAMGMAAFTARVAGRPWWREGLRRLALTGAGLAATFALLLATLAAEGVLGRFWFWTFRYASAYVSETPLNAASEVFLIAWRYITQAAGVLWYTALTGALLVVLGRWPSRIAWVLLGWLAATGVAVAVGFYFRPHYFILAMPVAACLIAVGVATVARWIGRAAPPPIASLAALSLFAAAAGAYVASSSNYLFSMTEHQLVRELYATNPFEESVAIGRYLRDRTSPADQIAVIGSEPQIYFYANRRSATGYIYTYPLMEPQPYAARMQQEMQAEIEAAHPSFIVFVASALSWMTRPTSDTGILTWANAFAARCYARVGVVDIPLTGPAAFAWDQESLQYQPRSASQVFILRRTAAPGCATAQ